MSEFIDFEVSVEDKNKKKIKKIKMRLVTMI